MPFASVDPVGVHETVFAQLIELYRSLSADLICLQEVHSQEVAEQLAKALNMRIHLTPGGHQPPYGVAVLWHPNATVEVTDLRGEATLPYRGWQRVTWRDGGKTLRLTHLHLPSPRIATDQPIEAVQADELNRFILESEFQSDVILGDFNAKPDLPHIRALAQQGYHDVALHCGCGDQSTSSIRRIDQIWLSNALVQQPVTYRVIDLASDAFKPHDETKKKLSDHQPLVIEIGTPGHEQPNG